MALVAASSWPQTPPSPVANPLVRHRHVDFHTIKLSLPASTGSSLGAYERVVKTQHLSIATISFVFEGTLGHESWLLNDIPGPVKYLCFLLAFFFCQQQKFVQWQMTAFFLRSSGDTGRGERAMTLELEELWKQQRTFTETSPGLHLHYFLQPMQQFQEAGAFLVPIFREGDWHLEAGGRRLFWWDQLLQPVSSSMKWEQ